jgi:hypothetical protein
MNKINEPADQIIVTSDKVSSPEGPKNAIRQILSIDKRQVHSFFDLLRYRIVKKGLFIIKLNNKSNFPRPFMKQLITNFHSLMIPL